MDNGLYAKETGFREKVFALAGAVGACDPEDTIVIAGTPRSGSTWLLEVLRNIQGYKALNEPLRPRYTGNGSGFGHRTFIGPSDVAPVQKAYLKKVCAGRFGFRHAWIFRSATPPGILVEHATRRKLVVKFCRINRMLQWFARSFEVKGIVFLIRHPCAVVSSMLGHGAWENGLKKIGIPDYPLDISSLPAPARDLFAPLRDSVETLEEALALMWCIDNYLPLFYYDEHPWIMLPYERMVTRGKEELERIGCSLGFSINYEMVEALERPSISVKGKLGKDPGTQLTKWKRKLTGGQIDRIMRLVDAANLSPIYGYDPEPNYEELNCLQDRRYRWS